MAFRFHPLLTQAQILAKLTELEEEKGLGKTITSAGAGDVNSSLQVQKSIQQRWDEYWYDLCVLDPTNYKLVDGILPNITHAKVT